MPRCRDAFPAPRRLRLFSALLSVLGILQIPPGTTSSAHALPKNPRQSQAAAPVDAKTWIGRWAEHEAYLRTAIVEKVEEVNIGVTKPRRAYFAPGGLIESMAWKPLKPGIHNGYWDSYKAEIAAYEMDKLLHVNMVPPAVERKVGRETGAAIMWVTPTRMWKMDETDAPESIEWTRQVAQMKMFDDLIGNTDRNAGNLLIDPSWHVILIDHSRGFTSGQELPTHLSRFDPDLWDRMQALTPETVSAAVERWIGRDEVRNILDRRAAMQKALDELVHVKGEVAKLPRANRP